MADNATLEPTERSKLLKRYIELGAVTTLVAHLHMVSEKLGELAGDNENMATEIDGDVWERLNPVREDHEDPTQEPDFARADALAMILAGELFLELAASSEEVAAEGRRLVGVGWKQLRTNLDLDLDREEEA